MDNEVGDILGTLSNKLEKWGTDLVALLPNLVVAVLLLLVFGLIARVMSTVARRSLDGISPHTEVNSLLAATLRIAVVVTGLFLALGVLQLDKTVTSLLAGVGIVGLALGFAFQDMAGNFVSGVIMAIRRPFRVGDLVESQDHYGIIERMDLRATRLRRLTGQLVIIPNKKVFENPIINYTETGNRRVDLTVGVTYGDDLEKVKRVTLKVVSAIPKRDIAREVELFFTEFGDSSINYTLRFWLTEAEEIPYLEARSTAIMAIKKAYDENGITIPFPIRTLDFSTVGGRRLDEVWPAK